MYICMKKIFTKSDYEYKLNCVCNLYCYSYESLDKSVDSKKYLHNLNRKGNHTHLHQTIFFY